MTRESQDDRFDSREAEIQYYADWVADVRPDWEAPERRAFAKDVVRLKEANDSTTDRPAAGAVD